MHVTNRNGIRHRDYEHQLHDRYEWVAKFVAVLDELNFFGAVIW
jgi:hypothetical protein